MNNQFIFIDLALNLKSKWQKKFVDTVGDYIIDYK